MAIPCSSAAAITCGSPVDPPACTMARTPASAAVWLGRVGVETLFIEPGSPWENGYNESFKRYAQKRATEARNFLRNTKLWA